MSTLKRRDFMKTGSLLTVGLMTGSSCANEKQNTQPAILDAIMNRRSVRHYKSTPVPDEHIHLILDAARMAPCAGNQQPWKFVVVTDTAIIQKLKKACIAKSIAGMKVREKTNAEELKEKEAQIMDYYTKTFSAPMYVAVLVDKEAKYPTYLHWDGPLAAENLFIAARALGYGTVHYTDTVPESVSKEVLNIPDRYERVCFTPIGVPIEWPDAPPKKDYASFIVENTF
ncbi:MAG: nitroreductase family protein [Calditrichaceae bacterium]